MLERFQGDGVIDFENPMQRSQLRFHLVEPDALAGGALSAKQSIPMILVGSSLGTAQKDIIIAASPDTLYIFGGTAAVSDAVVSSI